MTIETKFDIDEEVVIDTLNHFKRGQPGGTVQEIYASVGTKGGHSDGVECLVRYSDGCEFFVNEDDLLTVAEFEEANQERFEGLLARSAG